MRLKLVMANQADFCGSWPYSQFAQAPEGLRVRERVVRRRLPIHNRGMNGEYRKMGMKRRNTTVFFCAALFCGSVYAQVVANPDSGTADAGIASKAIPNVAANDMVNGAPATLGSGGNAVVTRSGSWPTGIVLSTTSGAITTTTSTPAGVYAAAYQLCDLEAPPVCSTVTDTVSVITPALVAAAESGTADAGIASRPIVNVAANDTINGGPATLGPSGNAAVVQSGAWPTGIALTPSTGAISTTVNVPAGVYSVTYNLCDRNVPPDCVSATDTVNVINASILPAPESATVDAGIASLPFSNVTSNDTVDGAAVVLGSSGNASVSTSGSWPAGIVLNTATGAVTTTIAVPAMQYPLTYNLCDRNLPQQCAQATDTLIVVAHSIVAAPDSGSAIVGVATKVIANVAANDTVNGVPAVLGSGGNATVAQSGWPSGIVLTPSTGAVATTAAQASGTYNLSYSLCDRNGPPAGCGTGAVTVTISAAIVALPIAGSAIVGTNGTPIGNVVVQDTVDTAPVVLGANATVTQADAWPNGFALNGATGAITSSSSVPVGTYSLPYVLCDMNASCATSVATVAVTPPYQEQMATETSLGDVEFDWGRDGIPCPTCNFGDGNDRANWTDRLGNIWIGHLDPVTGTFTSPGADDELADTTAYFWNTWGNGPEWAFSTQNGQVVSQLVYSRWQPGQPAQPQPGAGYSGAAYTTQTGYNDYNNGSGNNWTARYLPGAVNGGDGERGTNNSNLPEASQCNTDSLATVIYKNFASPLQLFTESVTSAVGTTPKLLPLPPGVTSNGIGERFVPCTHQMLFQASAPYGMSGQTVQQVFWYDWDSGTVEQLTTDPVNKYSGFMFKAPDFDDNYIFFTLANHNSIRVYEQSGVNADGSPAFTLVNSIVSPDPAEPYLNSPEPFINCTPTCTTYIFVTLASSNTQNGITQPNGVAVVALSPATPLFNILERAASFPARQRLDPEYFITPQGPYLYYNRIVPFQQGQSRYKNEGEWFIDMQLGAPSGSCVGSSAEDGLMPGC